MDQNPFWRDHPFLKYEDEFSPEETAAIKRASERLTSIYPKPPSPVYIESLTPQESEDLLIAIKYGNFWSADMETTIARLWIKANFPLKKAHEIIMQFKEESH